MIDPHPWHRVFQFQYHEPIVCFSDHGHRKLIHHDTRQQCGRWDVELYHLSHPHPTSALPSQPLPSLSLEGKHFDNNSPHPHAHDHQHTGPSTPSAIGSPSASSISKLWILRSVSSDADMRLGNTLDNIVCTDTLPNCLKVC